MNQHKPLFIASLMLVISLFVSTNVSAQEETVPEPVADSTATTSFSREPENEMILIAAVNLMNARIVSQDAGVIGIEFELVNDIGVQPGVFYSIEIIEEPEPGLRRVADMYLSSEAITLAEKEVKTLRVDYRPPAWLRGDYSIMLRAATESGLGLGIADLGTTTLQGIGNGVIIQNESCYLAVTSATSTTIDPKTFVPYHPLAGVDIIAGEGLTFSCSGFAAAPDGSLVGVPQLTTHERTPYGRVLKTDTLSDMPITFNADAPAPFRFLLPLIERPGAYDVVLRMVDPATGEQISAPTRIHYVMRGESGTIKNVVFDRAAYEEGDTAQLTFVYSGSADSFPNARHNEAGTPIQGDLQAEVVVTDMNAVPCAAPVSHTLRSGVKETITIPITARCINPRASLALKNGVGDTLDTAEASVDLAVPVREVPRATGFAAFMLTTLLLAAAGALLLHVTRGRNDTSNTASGSVGAMLLLSAATLGTAILAPAHTAEAYTFYVAKDNDPSNEWRTEFTASASNLNPTHGSSFTVSASAQFYGCMNVTGHAYYMEATYNGTTQAPVPYTTPYWQGCGGCWLVDDYDPSICAVYYNYCWYNISNSGNRTYTAGYGATRISLYGYQLKGTGYAPYTKWHDIWLSSVNCPAGTIWNGSSCISQNPTGWFDSTDNANCTVSGWACDPDGWSTDLTINVYKDGASLTSGTAGNVRSDVGPYCGGDVNHGFTISLPSSMRDGVSHSIRTDAVNIGGGSTVQLGNSPRSITCYACTGTTPSNATLCSGDDTGLTSNVAKTVVSSCTATKCQYTCNSGYTNSGGTCVASTYSCTGTAPSNATLCTGDDTGLSSNVANSVVSSCTATKCEYTCNSGYYANAGSCVAYSCTGTNPSNATLCTGDSTGLSSNVAKTVVSSCTAAKCEYTCNSGYTNSGGTCVASTYSCTGTAPSNATLCTGDDTGLSSNVANSVVSSCTATKCEYTCNSGYYANAGSCVAYSCTGTNPSNATLCTGDSTGLSSNVAKTVVSSCTAAKCEYTCNSGYTNSGGTCVASTYSCTGTAPSNATLCTGDDTGLSSNVANSVVSSCTATKCEYTCNSGYYANAGSCVAYSCTGTNPSNATLCTGDSTGLSSNVAKTVVSSCTAAKCEYTCNSGYYANAGSCVAYSCTGTNPSNATLCTGDSTGLSSNVAKTVVSSCTAAKCEYTCNSGYTESGGTCVASSYSCTGAIPSNATICAGDDGSLSSNVPNSVVSSCTATKCEYTCNSGYTESGGTCVASSYSCTGAIPSNATICAGDDGSLSSNVPNSVVSSCTATKCEYTCDAGYTESGGACVAVSTDRLQVCKGGVQIALDSGTVNRSMVVGQIENVSVYWDSLPDCLGTDISNTVVFGTDSPNNAVSVPAGTPAPVTAVAVGQENVDITYSGNTITLNYNITASGGGGLVPQ